MNPENGYKIVNFVEHCKKCKNCDTDPADDPCDECLSNPVNLYSSKPVNYEEK